MNFFIGRGPSPIYSDVPRISLKPRGPISVLGQRTQRSRAVTSTGIMRRTPLVTPRYRAGGEWYSMELCNSIPGGSTPAAGTFFFIQQDKWRRVPINTGGAG